MKNLSLLILALLFCLHWLAFRCEPLPEKPTPIDHQLDIDLANLKSNYLSLASYRNDTVYIGGTYQGDRIVLKQAEQLVIVFVDCIIQSTHAEDALVFADRTDGLEVWGQELSISGGGITFWNVARNVSLYGGSITDTHTGIRATSDLPHQNILINGWTITNASHEGVYLGVSKDTPTDTQGFYVTNNTISHCGWDGIQIGNCRYAILSGNTVDDCGYSGAYGQDYGITINPGTLAYVYENEITRCAKPIQVLDARVFFHAPARY